MVNAAPATNVAVAIAWRMVGVVTSRTLRQPRDPGTRPRGASRFPGARGRAPLHPARSRSGSGKESRRNRASTGYTPRRGVSLDGYVNATRLALAKRGRPMAAPAVRAVRNRERIALAAAALLLAPHSLAHAGPLFRAPSLILD